MTAPITKEQIVIAIAGLPDDATLDDAIDTLLFLRKIVRGLEQSARGETIHNEVAKQQLEYQIASWNAQR